MKFWTQFKTVYVEAVYIEALLYGVLYFLRKTVSLTNGTFANRVARA